MYNTVYDAIDKFAKRQGKSEYIITQIGVFHLAFSILPSLCVFLFASRAVDILFLAFCTIVVITWALFDGECIISYIAKKIDNPDYVMGSDPRNLMDMVRLFQNEALFSAFLQCNNIACILAIYIANSRVRILDNHVFMAIIAAVYVSWAAKLDIYTANWLAAAAQ